MSAGQITTGWRGVFSFPAVYEMAQTMIGSPNLHRIFVDEYVAPKPGDKVLDLGCGTAMLFKHFPDVDYLGIDISEEYIAAARRRHGGGGRFEVMAAEDLEHQPAVYNIVFSCGLLHHIDDAAARAVFKHAHGALKPGGRYVTYDPAFRKGQHPFARWIAKMDRGAHVRTPESYEALARTAFDNVTCDVREDAVLRYPATSNFMVSRRAESGDGPGR